jgi:hypothetical protein
LTIITIRIVSIQIVIAVAWLTHAVVASNDDGAAKGVCGAIGTIRIQNTSKYACGRIVSEALGCSSSGRGREENDGVEHCEFGIQYQFFKTCLLLDGLVERRWIERTSVVRS